MQTADGEAPEYWLFQFPAAEDRSSPEFHLSTQAVAQWPVTRYIKRIKPDDIVFLWQGGEKGGLLGWGRIASPGAKGDSVGVFVEEVFPAIIPRDEVRAIKEVSDLIVVARGQSGTDFAVSSLQAAGLTRIIEAKGFRAPVVELARVRLGALRRLESAADRAENIEGLRRVRSSINELRGLLDKPGAGSQGRAVEILNSLSTDLKNDVPRNPQARAEQAGLLAEIEAIIQTELAEPAAPWMSAPNADVFAAPAPAAPLAFYGSIPSAAPEADSIPPAPPPAPAAAVVPPASELDAPLASGITRWWDEDRADIADDVRNLSRYIAGRNLQPPQAIGIFGDWGSGKTFFMGAVRSEIADLAWQSGEAISNNKSSAFCRHVVQVEFNAWHYVESNLWASLAAHIFETLHRSLTARASGQQNVDALFKTLETAKAAVEAIERERKQKDELVKALQTQRDEVAKQIETDKNHLAKKQKDLIELSAKKIREAITQEVSANKGKLEALVGKQQLETAAVAGRDIVALANDARSVGTALWLEWKTRPYAVALAALTVVALIALPALASWVVGKLTSADGVAQFGAMIGTFLSLFSGAVAWLKSNGQGVLNAARRVQQLCAEADADAEKALRGPLTEAEVKLGAGQKELAAVDERLGKEKARLAEVERAVRGEDIVVRLRQFLEDRVRNKTYEQHLGLITLIRKDFETLSEIMDSARQRAQVFGAEFAAAGTSGSGGTVPVIERIVLYIDDLDRCPPGKVVDVLQAVHLLLGFKLFVVVVGVDVRWVGKALLKQYPELLVDDHVADPRGKVSENGGASSDDYLEKIFQIPFRIPPMNSISRKVFVSSLVKPRASAAPAPAGIVKVPVLELNPREFELDVRETDAIVELHNCLGRSPRRLKRFVEVYRLMRAGMAEGDVETLMSQHHYIGILGVFAIMTSLSAAGPRLVEAFYAAAQDGKFSSITFESWITDWVAGKTLDLSDYQPAVRVMQYFDSQKIVDKTRLISGLSAWSHKVGRYAFHDIRVAT